MRILTWNIVGQTHVPYLFQMLVFDALWSVERHRHPPKILSVSRMVGCRLDDASLSIGYRWNTLKNYEAILDELKADIICFQGVSLLRVQIAPHRWQLSVYGNHTKI